MSDLGYEEEKPVVLSTGQTLRYYQENAVQNIEHDFNYFDKLLLIMATGTGKTTVFSELIKKWINLKQYPVLVIAHRGNLLDQAGERIYQFTKKVPSLEKAENVASLGSEVVLATVQTLKGSRLKRYPRNHFKRIIIDEAHRTSASSYIDILEYFQEYKLLGVTATPDRSDKKNLGSQYEHITYQYSLLEGIRDEYLANIKGNIVKDFGIDLSGIRSINKNDFSQKELEEILVRYTEPIADALANEKIKDLRTIVFSTTVLSSKLISDRLNEIGIKSNYLSGSDDDLKRRRILSQFSSGEISHLVNCSLFTEGFDEPKINHVVIAVPTRSRVKYSQMVGRGTRLSDNNFKDGNGKQFIYLTEFTYTNTKHSLVTAYELFTGAEYDEHTQAEAIKNNSDKSEIDYLDELEEAKAERFDFNRIVSRLRIYGLKEYDPFAICDAIGVDISEESVFKKIDFSHLEGRATDKQLAILDRDGISYPEYCSKAQAAKLISDAFNGSPATDKQKYILRKNNIHVPDNLRKPQATAIISKLAENNWSIDKLLENAVQERIASYGKK